MNVLEYFEAQQAERGIDMRAVRQRIGAFKVEVPSWGFADSGTRFNVFTQKGAARALKEKLDDAAQVHKYTGMCPSVAIHIPWDKCPDYAEMGAYARSLGLVIGAVNPNYFQEQDYLLGSLTNEDDAIRQKALDHTLECVDIMKKTGSKALSVWLSDGTNYPGQGDIRRRKTYLADTLGAVMAEMDADMRMLLEYKMFEPAFYHTDLADWGMAFSFCQKLGDRAQVLVDLGHHAPGTNVEHIVAFLLDEGKLGGFHFNNRKYADDDLMVGSVNPFELFLIFHELINAEDDPATACCARDIAYMIDQSLNVEKKIPGMMRSVLNIQEAHAKALLVNRAQLAELQRAGDVLGAHQCLKDAYDTDVRPLLAALREEKGLAPDPVKAYLASPYEREKLSR